MSCFQLSEAEVLWTPEPMVGYASHPWRGDAAGLPAGKPPMLVGKGGQPEASPDVVKASVRSDRARFLQPVVWDWGGMDGLWGWILKLSALTETQVLK